MAKKELVVPAAMSLEVPDYLKVGEARGMENVDQKDILIPRVKLLQPLSPVVIDKLGEAGDIVSSVSGKPFNGDGKSLLFIPVVHFKSRIMFDGIGADAKIECSSADSIRSLTGEQCLGCEEAEWKKDKKGGNIIPKCQIVYNFIVLILGGKQPDMALLGMSSTKIKTAKKLLTLARHAGNGLDLFALKFKLFSVGDKGPKGSYYNYDVEGAGYASKEEFAFAEKFYNVSKTVKIKVDEDDSEQVKEVPAGSAAKPSAGKTSGKRSY